MLSRRRAKRLTRQPALHPVVSLPLIWSVRAAACASSGVVWMVMWCPG